MKGMWFIVEFWGEEVWGDLDFWSQRSYETNDIYVDYEYQKVWFKCQA